MIRLNRTIKGRPIQLRLGPDAKTGYVFVLPLVLVLIILVAYPATQGAILSFYKKPVGQDKQFCALANFNELLFEDSRFGMVFWNSLVFTGTALAGKLILGMIMALVLNEKIKGRSVWRSYLLLPWTLPSVIIGLGWRWLFNLKLGAVNQILVSLGLIDSGIGWLATRRWALLTVILANIWRGFPFFGLTYLAGLQAIPAELHEAAEVDGASAWQRFVFITIPGLRAVIFLTLMLSGIWTFSDFDLIWLITGGGPGWSTHNFATYSYEIGFRVGRFGYGTAIAVVMAPFLFILIWLLTPIALR